MKRFVLISILLALPLGCLAASASSSTTAGNASASSFASSDGGSAFASSHADSASAQSFVEAVQEETVYEESTQAPTFIAEIPRAVAAEVTETATPETEENKITKQEVLPKISQLNDKVNENVAKTSQASVSIEKLLKTMLALIGLNLIILIGLTLVYLQNLKISRIIKNL